jgi:hypothetical protein
MNHTQLLNYLADKYNLQSYLEIGVQNPANNFDKIKCISKVGVDPECLPYHHGKRHIVNVESDYFFNFSHKYFDKVDLVFIDGYHSADQVQRDFENSLKCLTDKGFIVIHDCLPEKEETTHVPRDSKMWHGDVYKFALNLQSYDGIDFITYDFDCGCCVVWKDSSKKGTAKVEDTWENYKLNGRKLMNVSERVTI